MWDGEEEKDAINRIGGYERFYVFDDDWESLTAISEEDAQYMHHVLGHPFSQGNAKIAASMGDVLNRQAGGYQGAAWMPREINLDLPHHLADNARKVDWAYHAIAASILDIPEYGVCP